VVASQAVSVPAVIVLALVVGGSWVPRGKPVRLGVLTGLLGVGATATFLLSTQHGFLTVAAVLASLYPATTVLLAWLVLREHIHRSQAVGLALCALAIVLVAGG
jgi:drug/metabolite transporter (DMT)-like permease